jgi:replicative DNA helicase
MAQDFSELDLRIEQALLGTLVRGRGENFPDALGQGLGPEDFFRDGHAEIYSAIADLYNRDIPVDTLTLSDKLRARGTYEAVGGEIYLAELEDLAVSFNSTAEYAKIIVDRAALRRLRLTAADIQHKCQDNPSSVDDLLSDAEAAVFDIRDRRLSGTLVFLPDCLMGIQERVAEIMSLEGRLSGIPTGYKSLDLLTGGFQKTDFIVLGGRPGMGKTAITLNLALNAALPGRREAYKDMPPSSVLIFSLEMGREQIIMRILSQLGRLSLHRMRTGGLSPGDLVRLTEVMNELSAAPIYIDDVSGQRLRPIDLRAKARRLHRNITRLGLPPLGLIVVDYLQLMNPNEQHANREREVAEISNSLKGIAKELGVTVLCCSQLKRADVEKPELSDLRDSGAIEQDADIVAFILRKELLYPDKPEHANKGELQIKKHRNGPTGVVYLHYIKECTSFAPLAYESFEPPPGGGFAPEGGEGAEASGA